MTHKKRRDKITVRCQTEKRQNYPAKHGTTNEAISTLMDGLISCEYEEKFERVSLEA